MIPGPALRVVRGAPTPAELAAVTVVLLRCQRIVAPQAVAVPRWRRGPAPRAGWGARPGAWRASALPLPRPG
ncbi:MAG TPA: acyl-CoA carboxylase epsilon subunit [Micromonosporaceae bacterium]|nr:acyl-CoA carboxylase epsilon subunit [Micromonosporaceae bacterium]